MELKKECENMIELEEIAKSLNSMKQKLQELGESL